MVYITKGRKHFLKLHIFATSFHRVAADPIHALVHVLITLFCYILYSKTWISVAGTGVEDIERELNEKELVVGRYRTFNTKSQLTEVVPIAVSFGGCCMGALALSLDFIGAPGILVTSCESMHSY